MKNPETLSSSERECLESFRAYVHSAYRDEFGVHNDGMADWVAEDWFFCDERHEHRFQELRKRLPKAKRVLDLACGMGTAVLYGLSQGFDCHGIEPDVRKLQFTRQRIEAGGMPEEWKNRFQRAVGELLPFHNSSFDAVISYQTLEHVDDMEAVLREMLRVVKPSGALYLRCPDYRGTFEGHYLLPWIPLMPRALARMYLRLCQRPLEGFAGIRYTTRSRIVHALERAEKATPGMHLHILDLGRERFLDGLRKRNLIAFGPLYPLWKLIRFFRGLFRRELQLDLWITVGKNSPSKPVT